jgi:hypothetical protein
LNELNIYYYSQISFRFNSAVRRRKLQNKRRPAKRPSKKNKRKGSKPQENPEDEPQDNPEEPSESVETIEVRRRKPKSPRPSKQAKKCEFQLILNFNNYQLSSKFI